MGRIKAGVYRGERVEAATPGRRGATGAWGFCPAVAGEIAVDFGWAWAWRATKIRELEAGWPGWEKSSSEHTLERGAHCVARVAAAAVDHTRRVIFFSRAGLANQTSDNFSISHCGLSCFSLDLA